MRPVNFRFDEFLTLDQSVDIVDEPHVVPAVSPYYVKLREIPKAGEEVVVTAVGSPTALTPTDDAWTDEGYTSTNHGSGTFNAAGRDDAGLGSWIYRAFHKWDLSSAPATASLAVVRFYRITGQGAPTYGIHRVTASWSEGSLTHASQPAFEPVADGQFTIVPDQNGWYEADITDLYNAWQAGTYTNYGIVLRTEEVDTNTVSNWASKEGSGGQAPQLVVSAGGTAYTRVAQTVAPAPGEFACAYGTGRLRFHVDNASENIRVSYKGTGSPIDAYDWYVDDVPSTPTSPGRKGQYAMNSTHAFFCYNDNQWGRVALSIW